jgi:hypothetical protein
VSKARVSELSPEIGSGDISLVTGNKIVSTDNAIYSGPGSIVQEVYVSAMPTSHLSTAGGPVELALTASITPKFKSSTIYVRFFSTMLYGEAGWLISTLYRRGGVYNTNNWFDVNNNAYRNFNQLTADTRSTYRYTYAWNYTSKGWHAAEFKYFDNPGDTTELTYKLYYQSSGTNYLVHQYQEYGWMLTEIRGKD